MSKSTVSMSDVSAKKLAQYFWLVWQTGYRYGIRVLGKKPPVAIAWSEASTKEQQKWIKQAKSTINYCRLSSKGVDQ